MLIEALMNSEFWNWYIYFLGKFLVENCTFHEMKIIHDFGLPCICDFSAKKRSCSSEQKERLSVHKLNVHNVSMKEICDAQHFIRQVWLCDANRHRHPLPAVCTVHLDRLTIITMAFLYILFRNGAYFCTLHGKVNGNQKSMKHRH